MKRLMVITFITLFTVASAEAQKNRMHKANYSSNEYSNELRQLRNFDHKLDKFSYALMTGDIWAARKNKAKIIRAMESEILDTRISLSKFSGGSSAYSKREGGRTYRGRSGGVYSRNNGRKASRYEEQLLIEQLERQIQIKNRFERTELTGYRSRHIVNERVHRKLMYRFRDTMVEGLEKQRGERRG
ncbi:MAG: hypothetical protein JJ971_15180 [Balneolaceae bacterium]|nr:hypothetical protein [Balneolaceae bacterium]MBO6547742.1 hypothetical protein [Balneolaceae bacterium]MBO6648253.1 hypothetical protein [Balneolaceae bacterium]